MIIKFTVHDNNYTNLIKPFYKDIKYSHKAWTDKKDFTVEDIDNIEKFDELLTKGFFGKQMTAEEVKQLVHLMGCKFDYFLKQIGEEKLIHQREIDIVSFIPDKNENGENIYYLLEGEQVIIL